MKGFSTKEREPPTGLGPDETYFAFLRRGELRHQQCADCATFQFVPRILCVSCRSTRLAWVELSGKGRVHAATTVHPPKRGGHSYGVALIDMAEGTRMMSRVEGLAPEKVRIGMAVEARVVPGDDEPLVLFVPSGKERS